MPFLFVFGFESQRKRVKKAPRRQIKFAHIRTNENIFIIRDPALEICTFNVEPRNIRGYASLGLCLIRIGDVAKPRVSRPGRAQNYENPETRPPKPKDVSEPRYWSGPYLSRIRPSTRSPSGFSAVAPRFKLPASSWTNYKIEAHFFQLLHQSSAAKRNLIMRITLNLLW
jgi:hypothetical protein